MTSLAASRRRRARWGLWQRHDFRLLWTGETTSSLGSTVSGVSLPLVALSVLHAHVLAVSALSATAWLPWVLIGLPAGAWVDRWPRRATMIAADLVSVAAFASIPVAAWLGRLSMLQLIVVAAVAGGASVFFATGYRAFIPTLLPAGSVMEANAKLQGSEQVTHIAGPGVAGVVAQTVGPVGGVVLNAVSFCVSALCLARIHVEETAPAGPRRALRHEIAVGLRVVRHDSLLRVNALFGCVSNLMLTGYQAILVVFLVQTVGLSAGATGALLATGSVGGVIGAAVARRVAARVGTARVVLWSKVGLMPFGALIPLAHRGAGLALFAVGSAVVIGGIVAGNVVYGAWVQSYVPVDLIGRVSTSVQVANYGAMPLGAVTAGAIAGATGVRTAMWVMMAGLVAASGILALGPLRRLRDLPSPRPAAGRATGG